MILRNKLIEDIISGQISEEEHEVVLKTIRRDLSKIFKEIIPKKFWIFPQNPYVYCLSNCLCIEMPGYGSESYLLILSEIEQQLRENFSVETHFFDGKITYLIKKNKNRNLYI